MRYSLINRRQLHVFSIEPKLDLRLIVDFCVFPCFSLYLPELNLKLVSSDVQNNFRFNSGKNGENTEINQQSNVKFWFNRKNMELTHIYLAVLKIFYNL